MFFFGTTFVGYEKTYFIKYVRAPTQNIYNPQNFFNPKNKNYQICWYYATLRYNGLKLLPAI